MPSNRETLENLAKKILGPRLSRILEEDPQFAERVVLPLLVKQGFTLGDPVDERTARWRALVKEVRRRAYYQLRRFRREGTEVPLEERSEEDLRLITQIICDTLTSTGVTTVVDLGSGLFPLTLPKWPCRPLHYIAIDSDRNVVRRLEEARSTVERPLLRPLWARLEDPTLPRMIEETGVPLPALGLALRTLRVLARTRGVDLVEWLSRLPLKALVASEPTRSLVGGRDIRLREKRFLARLARRGEELGLVSSWRLVESGSDVILILRF